MNLFYFFSSLQKIYTNPILSIEFKDGTKDIYSPMNILKYSTIFNSETENFNLKIFTSKNFKIVDNLLNDMPDKTVIDYDDLLEIIELKDFLKIDNLVILDLFYLNLNLLCTHSRLDLEKCPGNLLDEFKNWAPGIQDLILNFKNDIFYFLKIGEEDVIPVFEHKKNPQALLLTKDVCKIILDLDDNSMDILIRLVEFNDIKELVILDYVMVEKFVKKIAKLESITHFAYEVSEDIKLPANINILENIEGLALYVNFTKIESFKQINSMVNLKSLTIYSELVTYIYITNLTNLTNLIHLELSNIWLSSKDFDTISTYKKLQNLTISGFSHFNISNALVNLSDLKILKLSIKNVNPLPNQNITFVLPTDLSALKVLYLCIDDIKPGFGRNLPEGLEELSIVNCKIEDSDLQEIFKIISLKKLTVRNKNESNEAWNNICYLQNLFYLNVSAVALKPENMKAFTNLYNLKELDISNLEGNFRGIFNHIQNITSLVSLDVSGISMDKITLKKISTLEKIKRLHLKNTSITSLSDINLPRLTHLDLSNNKLTSQNLEELSNFGELVSLNLSNSIDTEISLQPLLKLTKLKFLTANNIIFTFTNMRTIFLMAEFLKFLEIKECRLDTLSDTNVGDKDTPRRIYANAPAIKNTKLRYIYLDGSELNFEDVNFLKQLHHFNMKGVEISNNYEYIVSRMRAKDCKFYQIDCRE